MTTGRVVLVVTCCVVAVLGFVFAVSQWETANRVATAASALAGVAGVGVAIWAALSGGARPEVVVRNTGAARAGTGGIAVSGYRGEVPRGAAIKIEGTGDAEADGGTAISGRDR